MEKEIDRLLRNHFGKHPMGRNVLLESFPDLGREHLEAAYGIGCDLLRHRKYGEAESIFYFLALMDHYEVRYWRALGEVLKAEKKYGEALGIYLGAFFLDPMEVEVVWEMAGCCLALGEREGAKEFLNQVRELWEETGKGEDWAKRAKGLLEMMEKKEGKEGQNDEKCGK
jgi:tetratricopeptide (TPR) repeat protein